MNERTNERTNASDAPMPPCSYHGCAALATPSGLCAVHARGLRRHHVAADAENTLRCTHCQRMVRDGEWFLETDGVVRHANPCVPPKE